jgi:hypothetical protein
MCQLSIGVIQCTHVVYTFFLMCPICFVLLNVYLEGDIWAQFFHIMCAFYQSCLLSYCRWVLLKLTLHWYSSYGCTEYTYLTFKVLMRSLCLINSKHRRLNGTLVSPYLINERFMYTENKTVSCLMRLHELLRLSDIHLRYNHPLHGVHLLTKIPLNFVNLSEYL